MRGETLKEIVPKAGSAEFLLLTQYWRGTERHRPYLPRARYVYGDAKAGGTFSEGTLVAALKAIDIGSPEGEPSALAKKPQSYSPQRHTNQTSFEHAALPVGSICDDRRSVAALVHAGTFAAMLNERDATSAALKAGSNACKWYGGQD